MKDKDCLQGQMSAVHALGEVQFSISVHCSVEKHHPHIGLGAHTEQLFHWGRQSIHTTSDQWQQQERTLCLTVIMERKTVGEVLDRIS